jgi:heme/copper-type cytochrome/quinol oxidase subunit 1
LIFYSISITHGGHPLFTTKGAQLTILIPVLVVFDSWYHHLVDLHFKLAAFIFSSCQAILSLSFSTLSKKHVQLCQQQSVFSHGDPFGRE